MSKPDRCTATTRDGRPCPGRPLPGKQLCFAHDPDLNTRPRRQAAATVGRAIIATRQVADLETRITALEQRSERRPA
jgi:hypothetical protein